MNQNHIDISNRLRALGSAVTRFLALGVGAALLLAGTAQIKAQRAGSRQPRGDDAQLEKAPIAIDNYEKKVFQILDDILENQRFRNVPLHDGRLLRILAETMDAQHVVEIGTSTGYSGIWFGLALKKTGGKLTTYEVDAERAKVARENFAKAEMDKIITLIKGDAHEEVTKLKGQIDILFLDADKQGYVDYLEKLLPLLRPGGLVIGHNINLRMADPKFMEAITTKANLETVVRGGVSITLKKE